jgi:hypothetical protein
MLKPYYIEDIFFDFCSLVLTQTILAHPQDRSAILSFYSVITDSKQFTENQSKFLIKILDKYKTQSIDNGLDYQQALTNPIWKNSFRTLDLSKKIFVETDEEKNIWVCCKFPFQLKEPFESEILNKDGYNKFSEWDPDRKIKKVMLHHINPVALYEFAVKHQFEIDETFVYVMSEIEEIWNRSSEIEKFSVVIDEVVYLVNTIPNVDEYWINNRTGIVENDLFLAKSMGYAFKTEKKSLTLLEKISQSKKNIFWIQDVANFFKLYKTISGNVCVLLDRSSDYMEYLQNFVDQADLSEVPRSDIKVCFRENAESKSPLNAWVKDNKLGGQIDSGRIFIFSHKPAKWLFKDEVSVKIIMTNNLYPDTTISIREWIKAHPCVLYVGKIKPSLQKEITVGIL